MRPKIKISIVFIIGFAALSYSQFKVTPYPETKKAPVVDDYFGVKVTDNYRWMEDMNNAEVQKWFKAQGEYADNILDKIPGRDVLFNEFLKLDSMVSYSISNIQRAWVTKPSGSSEGVARYFYLKGLSGQNVQTLYFRQGLNGEETRLYDPMEYEKGKVYAIQYYKPSNDGKKVAIGLAESGSEQARLLIMDVDTKQFYPESIYPCWFGVSDWLDDNSSFIYTAQRSGITSSKDLLMNTTDKIHTAGTDVGADRTILSSEQYPELGIQPEDILFAGFSDDRNTIIASKGGVQKEEICYYAPAEELGSKHINWKPLFQKEDEVVSYLYANDSIFFLSVKDAPNTRMFVTSAVNPDVSNARLVIPEMGEHIRYFTRSKSYIFLAYSNGITQHLVKYSLSGGFISPVESPREGITGISTYDIYDDNGIVAVSGWTTRLTRYDYNGVDNKMNTSVFNVDVSYPGAEDIVAKEVEARSYDGTMVPLSIIMDKNTKLDGNNFCYLTGYGAYGSSLTPYFSFVNLDLIKKGVIIAYAHVRGGGEKGDAWHMAGFKTTKQNTWKDLIACAEYLIKEKYTSNTKLFAEGTSAGGILIGMAITERPDLFAAAICNVGCANILRAEASPNGPNNTREFGTIKIEDECKALIEMDALTHVQDGIKYPAVLCITGFNDPRVAPWQPGKFAGALQSSSVSGKPVLLRVDYNSGHFSAEKLVTFKLLADKFAFCLWQAGHPEFMIR